MKIPWPFLKSIAAAKVIVVEEAVMPAVVCCAEPDAPKASTLYIGPALKRCGESQVLSAANGAADGLAFVPSNVNVSRVQTDAAEATGEAPATLDGNTKVRPPVPSWQMSNSSCWPATAPAKVELVTLPVSVILKLFGPLLLTVNVGVAEKETVV